MQFCKKCGQQMRNVRTYKGLVRQMVGKKRKIIPVMKTDWICQNDHTEMTWVRIPDPLPIFEPDGTEGI